MDTDTLLSSAIKDNTRSFSKSSESAEANDPPAVVPRPVQEIFLTSSEQNIEEFYARFAALQKSDGVLSLQHKSQITFFSFFFTLIFLALYFEPLIFAKAFSFFATVFFSFLMIGKIYFLVIDFFKPHTGIETDTLTLSVDDPTLPEYTILVPLYREHKILPRLKRRLEALQYPEHKKRIILILEEDDEETVETAKMLAAADPEPAFQILLVPPGEPHTKPKAMNFALPHIRGEYFTIYDAEDEPDPDQLLKAVAAFRAAPSDVSALQARLTYVNYNVNWLTRMFTVEYEVWFRQVLPGLTRLSYPVPLSGTSTHMRTADMKRIFGWDSYNVAEDCDLGMRLARAGLRAELLDSVTREEAVFRIRPWLRQRSRWLKGYMQTWITHSRRPIYFYKKAGWRGVFSLYFVVGAMALSALALPPGLIFFFWSLWQNAFDLTPIINPALKPLLLGLLVCGAVVPFLSALTVFSRSKTIPDISAFYGFSHIFYWFLAGVSAYRSLFELQFYPTVWHKTDHSPEEDFPAQQSSEDQYED